MNEIPNLDFTILNHNIVLAVSVNGIVDAQWVFAGREMFYILILKNILDRKCATALLNLYIRNSVRSMTNDLIDALEFFQLPKIDFGSSPVNYEDLANTIMENYPMLEYMDITGYQEVSKKKLKVIVDYIESVMAKKDLTPELELV